MGVCRLLGAFLIVETKLFFQQKHEKFEKKKKHTTQPLKQIWTGPIDKCGKLYLA